MRLLGLIKAHETSLRVKIAHYLKGKAKHKLRYVIGAHRGQKRSAGLKKLQCVGPQVEHILSDHNFFIYFCNRGTIIGKLIAHDFV